MSLTDTKTIKQLNKYYIGSLPADGIRFTTSLFSKGKFAPDYKARCIMKILYLEDTLDCKYITTDGWNAIYSRF